jgi:diguanylate cyclase (GGDEF)-like protein/PAS domain S-box-containing protein
MRSSDFDRLTQLQQDSDLFRFITENSSDIISFHEADARFRYISPVFHQIIGYHPSEWIGRTPYELTHPDDHTVLNKQFRTALMHHNKRKIIPFVYRVLRKDGKYAWIETTARSVKQPDGTIEGFVAVSRDVTERKKMEEHLKIVNEQLQKLSLMDGLTGIANRRHFDHTFEKEWLRAIRHQHEIALIMFDIDDFKQYNDEHGHLQGDECLKAVAAKALETFQRSTDFVARYGGEEFMVILPQTPLEMSMKLAEKLRDNIQSLIIPHPYSDHGTRVTISIGVAHQMPLMDSEPLQFIDHADQAMYASKRAGRNRVSLYSREE